MENNSPQICPHCKMDKAIRNPSGFCDHLHYPDYCPVCRSPKIDPKQEAAQRLEGIDPLIVLDLLNAARIVASEQLGGKLFAAVRAVENAMDAYAEGDDSKALCICGEPLPCVHVK